MAMSVALDRDGQARVKEFLGQQGILVAFAVFLAVFAVVFRPVHDGGQPDDRDPAGFRSSARFALGVTIRGDRRQPRTSRSARCCSFATVLVVDLHDKIGPGGAILTMFRLHPAAGRGERGAGRVSAAQFADRHAGMLSAIQGLTLIYSNGQNVDIVNQEGTWFRLFSAAATCFGIAVPVLIFIGLAIILELVNAAHALTAGRSSRSAATRARRSTAALRRSRLVFSDLCAVRLHHRLRRR